MKIDSSYTEQVGKILFDKVIQYKPEFICDIGVLNGFSTYYLTKAAKIVNAKVFAVDLFEDYEFNKITILDFKQNMKNLNVLNNIEVIKSDYEIFLNKTEIIFDFIHFDVSNDGEKIINLINSIPNKPKILFEGGSIDRDNQDWMIKYNKQKIIETLNENKISFDVLFETKYKKNGREFYPCISEICW